MDQRPNPKTIKPLEENIDVNPHDLGLGNGFLKMTPKAQAVKENKDKLGITKIQNFCASEDSFKKVKRQPTDREKNFANPTSNERTHKEFFQYNKETNNPIKMGKISK